MEKVLSSELIRLRSNLGRYRSLHQRALKRLDDQRARHREEVCQLKADFHSRIEALSDEIVQLKRQVKTLQDLHFGKSSEKNVSTAGDLESGRKKHKRKRGQQPGRKGHGRRLHTELPCEEETLDLSAEEARCPLCGLAAEKTQAECSSEEISYEVRVIRKRRRRPYYKRTCDCPDIPRHLSAPLPLRAFRNSKYSDSLWIEVLLFKYEYQFPLERFVRLLDSYGLRKVSLGTLCGGIACSMEMLRPLYDAIKSYNQSSLLRHMDETGLKVFVEKKDKATHVWWLWQSSTTNTCVFFLDRNRSYDVPSEYLTDTPKTAIICADRYKVYAKLLQKIAYCRAHVRRDFVRIGRGERSSRTWAIQWLQRIKKLYRLNRKRIAAKGKPEAFSKSQDEVMASLDEMEAECKNQLASRNWCYNETRRKALESMKNHWNGLTVFLTDPDIPLDNNFAERLFRSVANFRKSCFGVHSEKFVASSRQ
jgi:transposase